MRPGGLFPRLLTLGFAIVLSGLVSCRDEQPTAPAAPATDGLSFHAGDDDDDDDGERGRLQSDNVEAVVVFTHVEGQSRICEGEEGPYAEERTTLTGTVTGDPRLAGRIVVRFRGYVNIAEGLGPLWGTAIIRDPVTKRKKAEGEVNHWGPLDMTQGTLVGRVYDRGVGGEPTSGAGRLIANWRIHFAFPSITATIGGATTDNRLPAGLWSGQCSGKFERFEFDLTAPTLAASRSGGWMGRFGPR